MLLRIGRREAMRKKQVLQLLTMLTATAAVCAGLFLRHQPMEVAAVRVEKGNICRTVGVAGTVCYTQETPVTAMVSGMVDALYVIEGERVTQGQALARISGGTAQEQAVLALMTHLDADGRSALTQTLAEGSVLRAPVSGIVQRVATAAYAPVQAGSIPMTIAAARQKSSACAFRRMRKMCALGSWQTSAQMASIAATRRSRASSR